MATKKKKQTPKFSSAAIERDVLDQAKQIASPNSLLKEVIPLIQYLASVPSVHELTARLAGDDLLTDALLSLRAMGLRSGHVSRK